MGVQGGQGSPLAAESRLLKIAEKFPNRPKRRLFSAWLSDDSNSHESNSIACLGPVLEERTGAMDWQLAATFLLMLMVFVEGSEIRYLKKRIRALELSLLRRTADVVEMWSESIAPTELPTQEEERGRS